MPYMSAQECWTEAPALPLWKIFRMHKCTATHPFFDMITITAIA
jgi:hypothetical protein